MGKGARDTVAANSPPARPLVTPDRIMAINPNDPNALFNRFIQLARLGRLEEAVAVLDKFLTHNEGFADAWFERGNLVAALSRYGEAADSYARALRLAPSHLGALTNRGNALMELR